MSDNPETQGLRRYFKPEPRNPATDDNKSSPLPTSVSPAATIPAEDDTEDVIVFSRKRKRNTEKGCLEPKNRVESPINTANTDNIEAVKSGGKKPRQKSKSSTQLYLDVGQRDFHSTRCSVCGLVYSPGDPDDERLHKAHHSNITKGIQHTTTANEKLILTDGTNGKIYSTNSSPSNKTKQMIKIAEFIEGQLGTAPGWLLSVPLTVYLYVANKTNRIVGCAAFERVQTAKPVGKTTGNILVTENESVKVQFGVRFMWVSLEAQRKGIATKMLDCARSRLAPGYVIPRNRLAFSQPTEQGAAFMRKYSGEESFLMYT